VLQEQEATMLYEFLTTNREELVRRCREKVAKRTAPSATSLELEHGIPMFLEQLITMLWRESLPPASRSTQASTAIGATAGKHGHEFYRQGFAVDQVVHDYGDLCQSVTELAAEMRTSITVDEFRTFNRCLDDAIADAVTAFGHARDRTIAAEGVHRLNERLGSLAHELRNLLNSAILAFDAIKSGSVAVTGATGSVLARSLMGLRDVIDRSLAEVRLGAGLDAHQESINVSDFVQELQVAAAMDAKSRHVAFIVAPIDRALTVDADRQMLGSAVSNLLQNAFKFSRRDRVDHGSCDVRSHPDRRRGRVRRSSGRSGRGPVSPFRTEEQQPDRGRARPLDQSTRGAGEPWHPPGAQPRGQGLRLHDRPPSIRWELGPTGDVL
jgi:signal transduction histidine kinase